MHTDPWGNGLRFDNLPKNHEQYPYILSYFPNEAYELKSEHGAINGYAVDILPKKFLASDYSELKENIERWFSLMFNLDYRTINNFWSRELLDLTSNGITYDISERASLDYLAHYVDFVRENKLVTSGRATAEISTIRRYNKSEFCIRVYYEYSVNSGNTSAITATVNSHNSIFRGQTREHDRLYSPDYKLGDVIKVVSEIPLSSESLFDIKNIRKYKVSRDIYLSETFVYVE